MRKREKRPTHGLMVRVKRDVEALLRDIAEKLGYEPFTVRNAAILYGLQSIALNRAKVPETDEEFKQLLEETKRIIEERGYA